METIERENFDSCLHLAESFNIFPLYSTLQQEDLVGENLVNGSESLQDDFSVKSCKIHQTNLVPNQLTMHSEHSSNVLIVDQSTALVDLGSLIGSMAREQ